jgi:hypothetical protein
MYLWYSVQDVVIKDILLSFAHYSYAVRRSKFLHKDKQGTVVHLFVMDMLLFFISTFVNM